MTTLITASLIVFGIFGYRLLAVAALPAVDFPTIQITATLPGAVTSSERSRPPKLSSPRLAEPCLIGPVQDRTAST
jgi:hydrophobic/amphiphilic exporter-1 (mainly G- bacteria), HAE1 family